MEVKLPERDVERLRTSLRAALLDVMDTNDLVVDLIQFPQGHVNHDLWVAMRQWAKILEDGAEKLQNSYGAMEQVMGNILKSGTRIQSTAATSVGQAGNTLRTQLNLA